MAAVPIRIDNFNLYRNVIEIYDQDPNALMNMEPETQLGYQSEVEIHLEPGAIDLISTAFIQARKQTRLEYYLKNHSLI